MRVCKPVTFPTLVWVCQVDAGSRGRVGWHHHHPAYPARPNGPVTVASASNLTTATSNLKHNKGTMGNVKGRCRHCKGNPLCFRLLPVFRFRSRRSRSRHLVSLLQRLRSHDIVCHPLPTCFPSDPPSTYDTLTQHVCRTLHIFTNFGLISYIHYFVY